MEVGNRFSTLIVLAGFLFGCSAGSDTFVQRTADDFSLSILPETAVHGTSDCTWDTVVEPTADGCIISITASGAVQQKALYFDLAYDARALHPVAATPVAGIADCEPLTITVLDDCGMVHYGQILPTPAERDGFSGDGVVATVEFRRGAAEPTRRIRGVPTHEESSTTLEDSYPATLNWTGRNVGDCNQDGLVNATDLTPIGVHYSPEAYLSLGWLARPAMQAVDTDNNGLITAADITAIGRNYGNSILGGYRIYASADPADYTGPGNTVNGSGAKLIGSIGFADAEERDLSISLVAFKFRPASPDQNTFYWVRPVDLEDAEGIPSSLITQIGLDAPRGDEFASQARLVYDDSELKLCWEYRFPGDYNHSFTVSTSDLTLIGQHMGKTGPFDDMSYEAVVDGNGDNRIDLNDAYYVWKWYGTIPQYAIFASTNPTDYPQFNDSAPNLAPIATIFGASARSDSWLDPNRRGELEFTLEDLQPGMYYWVRLVDENGYCGTPSNLVGGP